MNSVKNKEATMNNTQYTIKKGHIRLKTAFKYFVEFYRIISEKE